jgi:flagellar hook-basal body complex protein FliE
MVNMNSNVSGIQNSIKNLWEQNAAPSKIDGESFGAQKPTGSDDKGGGFSQAIKAADNLISKVDMLQQSSDASIQELLSGKNQDITSVVSAVAKADMSFKLLVGVRNKLIEAYKQTMNMPV